MEDLKRKHFSKVLLKMVLNHLPRVKPNLKDRYLNEQTYDLAEKDNSGQAVFQEVFLLLEMCGRRWSCEANEENGPRLIVIQFSLRIQ